MFEYFTYTNRLFFYIEEHHISRTLTKILTDHAVA
jgi:hypothetical protein